jgi:type VI secretion system protein ImpF
MIVALNSNTRENLQPSLLDRLIDDNPEQLNESRNKRIMNISKLRDCVIRDISNLLNTHYMEGNTKIDQYPAIKSSVINYGVSGLTGFSMHNIDIHQAERNIRQAIISFEPRILKHTLKVSMTRDTEKSSKHAIVFRIEGQIWAIPIPLMLMLKTEIDLETGSVNVVQTN